MLSFGLLKLVDPFRSWYATQIATGGLPGPAGPLGIGSEIVAGVLYLGGWFVRRSTAWTVASLLVIGMMLVATYVHLQPAVPADALPLGIKPPLMPLTVLAAAAVDLTLLRRSRRRPGVAS